MISHLNDSKKKARDEQIGSIGFGYVVAASFAFHLIYLSLLPLRV